MFILRPYYEAPLTFFRGSFLTLARDIPAFCSYFMTYELLRELFKESDGSLGLGSTAVIGGLSGVVGWAVEIPLDALKSRHQGCLRYNSLMMMHCISYLGSCIRGQVLLQAESFVCHTERGVA